MNLAIRIYRRLARTFPHEFQLVYGADMMQVGEDVIRDLAKRHGWLGLLRLILDLAVRIPAEYLSEIRRDLIYAARTLAGSPGFAAVGIVSLGLGIGVTSTIFSEINALMFRDLPVARNPSRLVMSQGPVSYPYFEQYRDHSTVASGAAAYMPAIPFSIALSPSAKAQRVFGQIVSPEYFSVLGVPAARGRVFSAAYDQPGEASAIVVSDRFWRERLNSDPAAVGRTLLLNGRSATIVGVSPEDFLGAMPILSADVFLPATAPAISAPELSGGVLQKRDAKSFTLLMRLAPGETMQSAEAALDTMTRHLDDAALDPDRNRKGRRIRLLAAGGVMPMPPESRPVLFGFMGTLMGLILAIACMNLANILLAKASVRRREIAIRLAVGASRFRLIRQLLTESVLLAVCGEAAGIAFAYWLTNVISTLKLPVSIPFHFDIRPDWHMLVFTLALSLITGIGFGLAPAFAATKTDVAPALKEGGVAQMRGYRRFGMRNLLVVWQVAGSLMLLLITGFLVLGYNTLASANAAFDTRTMYLVSIDPIRDGYSPDQTAAFFDKLPRRLANLPGVQGVALAANAPFSSEGGGANFLSTDTGAKALSSASKQAIGPGYFAALNERMLAGREFTDRDQKREASSNTAMPVIVNQTAARELFGAENPVGRRITEKSQIYEAIGMVRDLKGPSITPASQAAVYLPMTREALAHPPAAGLTLMVRSNAGTGMIDAVRQEIASLDPKIGIFNVRTLAQFLDDWNAYIRLGTFFYGGLGLFGLILGSVGLAGVTAYAVAQRRKEIGIRMALGARKGQVLRLVLREGTTLVIVGSVLGFAGAAIVARAMSAVLEIFARVFKTGTADPRLIVGAPLLLAGLAMLACYLPARRSTRVDPLRALREE